MNIGATYLGNGHTEFTVWAPLKEKMTLRIVHPFDKRTEMHKDEQGYFQAIEKVEAGCKYFFNVDGRDLPDPASKFQPEGVHGPSQSIDHRSYKWKDERSEERRVGKECRYRRSP